MTVLAILLPVFVQVGLTFALLILMGLRRKGAVDAGQVKRDIVLLDDRGWPPRVRQVSNAFRNQFELPVLFYALVPLVMLTRKADLVFVVLCWVFVLSRLGHAFVHVTSNDIKLRFPLFAVGMLALLALWAMFALAILFAPVLP